MYCIIKFGGTSLQDIDRIRHASNIILKKQKNFNHKIIVVVSAMAKHTDKITHLFQDLKSELEMAFSLSSGEMLTAGLLSATLNTNEVKSIPVAGWQVPILTNSNYLNASIIKVSTNYLEKICAQSIIPVVTGFQGIDENNHITTLGRGGSDTSAVAIAAFLKLKYDNVKCEIYTDVKGIYDADPNLYSKANLLHKVGYDTLYTMASNGAKVMHAKAVKLAKEHKIEVKIRSTLKTKEKTLIKQYNNNRNAIVSQYAIWVTWNGNEKLQLQSSTIFENAGLRCCVLYTNDSSYIHSENFRKNIESTIDFSIPSVQIHYGHKITLIYTEDQSISASTYFQNIMYKFDIIHFFCHATYSVAYVDSSLLHKLIEVLHDHYCVIS